GAGDGPAGGRLRAHARRRPPLSQSRRAGAAAAHAGAATAAANAARPGGDRLVRLSVRGFHPGRLRAAPAHQGQGGGGSAGNGASGTAPSARAPSIVVVVAVADNGVIGQGGRLPWRLRSELAHFRRVTVGKPVVMGRKTFLSIGKPLAGRTNIVASRDASFAAPGVVVAPSVEAALTVARGDALR